MSWHFLLLHNEHFTNCHSLTLTFLCTVNVVFLIRENPQMSGVRLKKNKKIIQHEHTHTQTRLPATFDNHKHKSRGVFQLLLKWPRLEAAQWQRDRRRVLVGVCVGGVDNAWEKKGQSGGWREAPLGFFFSPQTVSPLTGLMCISATSHKLIWSWEP